MPVLGFLSFEHRGQKRLSRDTEEHGREGAVRGSGRLSAAHGFLKSFVFVLVLRKVFVLFER